ncbi:MAG: hypothetical protein AAF698_00820 [Pseudomonadota bacterium]
MRHALIFLTLTLAAGATGASEPMTPEEFGEYATGYTLYFERDGEPWGSEHFDPDGSVTWRFPSGTCVEGVWRPYEDQVCFYYGQDDEVLCWSMSREGDGLVGVLDSGEEAGLRLEITGRDRRPLICGEGGSEL